MGFFSRKSPAASSGKSGLSPRELKERCVLLQNNAKPVLTDIIELKKWCSSAEKECTSRAGSGNVMIKSTLLNITSQKPPASTAKKPSQKMLGAYVKYLQDRLLELREEKKFWTSQKSKYSDLKARLGIGETPSFTYTTDSGSGSGSGLGSAPSIAKSEPPTTPVPPPVMKREMSDADLLDYLSPAAKKEPLDLDSIMDEL